MGGPRWRSRERSVRRSVLESCARDRQSWRGRGSLIAQWSLTIEPGYAAAITLFSGVVLCASCQVTRPARLPVSMGRAGRRESTALQRCLLSSIKLASNQQSATGVCERGV